MTGGKASGTTNSAEMLAADINRDKVTIILASSDSAIAIGIDEAAVADKGIVLREIGDSVELIAHAATAQINIIGNTGDVTYQTGPVTVRLNGGTPT